MTQNKLLRRLEAIEKIIKPQTSKEIPPVLQKAIDLIKSRCTNEVKDDASEGGKHEK